MQNKKKVLHLTYDMRIGGTEQVIKNIVQSMHGSDFEHSILCIEQPIGPFGNMLINEGITINAFQRKDGFDIALIKQIRNHIKQHNINVLHCHQYTPWVYGSLAAAFTHTKVIFTEHGRFYPDSSSWKRKLVNPILVGFTDKITAISKATQQALVDFEFIPKQKIDVIYNGITELRPDKKKVVTLRSELAIPDNTVVLGTVARLDPIKNHTMMIKAFGKLLATAPNCCLLIVGDGEEKATLKQLVQELAITDHVIFTGYVEKPVHHLALMDVFLLPSLSEGTSMTLLEAMSLSIPIAATAVGGTPEIVQHKKNGELSANDELQAYHHILETLVSNHEIRNTYGKQARTDYLHCFTAINMSQRYETLYKTIQN